MAECEILVPASAVNTGNEIEQQDEEERSNNSFKIQLLLGDNANPKAHEAARVCEQEILKSIKAKIDLDRQGHGDAGSTRYHDSYMKMTSKLAEDMMQISTEHGTGVRKWK